ncbi:MAG: 23S rRNA (adenine(2030)-N(6))-methyltransferase RlmJ [Burkholderiaceae bacterium]|nr:23S rRNA (adenine(2030)-N(6))-methyltransferase RlmJ [Burkholderiaceae bacterium]
MFSYRHAFHAGNHADVLKHVIALAAIEYLTSKGAPLMVVDTHAGAGFYALDSGYAMRSAEALSGISKLWNSAQLPPLLQRYLQAIREFNLKHGSETLKFYPGSPLLLFKALRGEDKLRLFELHPADHAILAKNMQQLQAGRQIIVQRANGFEGLKAYLPPPQRRALVLMDPSYEDKADYKQVYNTLADALTRLATGTYMVWYPIIERPESRNLPERLKKLSLPKGTPPDWLHVALNIGQALQGVPMNLQASGVFIFNPPYTLEPMLRSTLPVLVKLLGGRDASYVIESGTGAHRSSKTLPKSPSKATTHKTRPKPGAGLPTAKNIFSHTPRISARPDPELAEPLITADPRGIHLAKPLKSVNTAAGFSRTPKRKS